MGQGGQIMPAGFCHIVTGAFLTQWVRATVHQLTRWVDANPMGRGCSVAVDQWIRAAGLAVVLGGRDALQLGGADPVARP